MAAKMVWLADAQDHLNTRLVRYLDPQCTEVPLKVSKRIPDRQCCWARAEERCTCNQKGDKGSFMDNFRRGLHSYLGAGVKTSLDVRLTELKH